MNLPAGRRPAHIRPAHVLHADDEALLVDFDLYGLAANHRPETRRERQRIVRQFARETGERPAQFTRGALLYAQAADTRSDSTRLSYFRALQAWHRWLIFAGHREDDPMVGLPKPREPKRQPRPALTGDLERLLRSGIRTRTRLWIVLAAFAGLRAAEIAALRGEDVNLGARVIYVRGKGGVDRTVPLHPVLALVAGTMPARGWWFPARGGQTHVHRKTVSITVNRAMVRARVSGTLHSARHWYGTEALNHGGTIRQVQELLGHGSVATTQLYTHVNATGLHAVVEALPDITGNARVFRLGPLPDGDGPVAA